MLALRCLHDDFNSVQSKPLPGSKPVDFAGHIGPWSGIHQVDKLERKTNFNKASQKNFDIAAFLLFANAFAASFGCRSCKTHFPTLCEQPSELAVLFNWNLNRRPFLRQVFNLDLLLCTRFYSENACMFLCLCFTQRWINNKTIAPKAKHCICLQHLLAKTIKNYSQLEHEKKKS